MCAVCPLNDSIPASRVSLPHGLQSTLGSLLSWASNYGDDSVPNILPLVEGSQWMESTAGCAARYVKMGCIVAPPLDPVREPTLNGPCVASRAKVSIANKDIEAAAASLRASASVQQTWAKLLEEFPAHIVAAGAVEASELERSLMQAAQSIEAELGDMFATAEDDIKAAVARAEQLGDLSQRASGLPSMGEEEGSNGGESDTSA
eukprot:scaffold1328_cov394-Prasinococcus_capsulatus_cf.AAC.8